MVEVFATNIKNLKEAKIIEGLLAILFPSLKVNFDLTDCDRVLRVEAISGVVDPSVIVNYLQNLGYSIKVLDW